VLKTIIVYFQNGQYSGNEQLCYTFSSLVQTHSNTQIPVKSNIFTVTVFCNAERGKSHSIGVHTPHVTVAEAEAGLQLSLNLQENF
jgi:hypothetical protein